MGALQSSDIEGGIGCCGTRKDGFQEAHPNVLPSPRHFAAPTKSDLHLFRRAKSCEDYVPFPTKRISYSPRNAHHKNKQAPAAYEFERTPSSPTKPPERVEKPGDFDSRYIQWKSMPIKTRGHVMREPISDPRTYTLHKAALKKDTQKAAELLGHGVLPTSMCVSFKCVCVRVRVCVCVCV
jgi:hypothetical protein